MHHQDNIIITQTAKVLGNTTYINDENSINMKKPPC